LLSTDLNNVAIELISEFGSVGKFIKNDESIDPITQEVTGSSSEIDVEYYIEYYQAKEFIENRIIAGDAKLLFTLNNEEPKTDWSFRDVHLHTWNILSVAPIESQDLKIVYEAHVRK